MKKTKVIIIYGGRSTEHEVSCRSAAFVYDNLDRGKYDVSAIAITKAGKWLPQSDTFLAEKSNEALRISDTSAQPALSSELLLRESLQISEKDSQSNDPSDPPTVIFPVLHGTNGEDGTLQGLMELAGLAYVGSDHLGSAIGMDKAVSKKLAAFHQVPVGPYQVLRADEWALDQKACLQGLEKHLKFPVFIKPANLGSSVGITKAKDREELTAGCITAFHFDSKILVEQALNVREIEVGAMGDHHHVDLTDPGEVISAKGFYDYESKYIDKEASQVQVPADLTPDQIKTAKALAKDVFHALELYGLARIDLFLCKDSGQFFFNEVNTLPGFTSISQFPLLWRHSGLKAPELLDRLIELALKRQQAKKQLQRTLV